jgi:hypothetical protein
MEDAGHSHQRMHKFQCPFAESIANGRAGNYRNDIDFICFKEIAMKPIIFALVTVAAVAGIAASMVPINGQAAQ